MKTQIFHMQNIPIFKKSSKRNQNPSKYSKLSITNLNIQHKPKYHLSNSSYKNRPIIYYLRAYKNPISYYIL
jgi:hypothetical protein